MQELASALGVRNGGAPAAEAHAAWIAAVASDLRRRQGMSAVIPGEQQSPQVHVLAHEINRALGNIGKTVMYTEPLEIRAEDQAESLRNLVSDLNNGRVELLLILGGNPVYTAPADLGFAEALRKVKSSVHAGLYRDETAALCDWQVPESHFLEEWGDTRAFDGTVSIMQPMIEPLYESHSLLTILDGVVQYPARTSYEIVRAFWNGRHKGQDFEAWWRQSVGNGLVADSALLTIQPTPAARQEPVRPNARQGMEIVFRPDRYIYDGRWANNSWLQELPRPVTKLTWDNAVHLSLATASRLSVKNDDVVRLHFHGKTVEGTVWVSPGHPDNSVTLHLGWGRTHGGRAANGAGFNAYEVRTSDALWSSTGLAIEKTGRTHAWRPRSHSKPWKAGT